MSEPIFQVRGICKRFPGVQALNKVHLELYVGEILAVIGENGAGKSTLMKILGGIYSPDEGEILYGGKKVTIDSVQTATKLGIALIHQELNLSDNLDIAANVFLGREPYKMGLLRLTDRNRIYKDTEKVLRRLGVDYSPKTIVTDLPIGQQQMVEIAKALSINACILIMDEPTSSLSKFETEQLFSVMRELKSQGVSIIYVSHRLGEVKDVADRVTVLRDGCNSGDLSREEIDHERMVQLMVGRNIQKFYHHIQHFTSKPVLEVRDLIVTSNPKHPVNFKLHSGEILVMAGLVGAGRTELLHTLFGIDEPLGGTILLNGKPIVIKSPSDAIHVGIGLVPEDRRLNGLILEMVVEANITLAGLPNYQKMKFIRFDQVRSVAKNMVRQLKIHTPSIDQEMQLLSGGNQQKVVLAKWLSLKPRILLLDEPTRGLDIVSKEEIYRLMEKLVLEGVSILMASSEMLEVLGIADRILAMHEGRISSELNQEQFSEETIVNLTTGGK
ncbi:MAG: D-xylose ABC transporter ATP-binding protein [Candidatus Altiarchaeales archaeon WOR_SM1_79]|nr:MAG: D-xylose ABC transporter ATP-binding protein [Candidatus Altiarchaeales archaeon WOR_SM1_79]